ncbi:MAG: hypothetical protein M1829_004995 [Trizodia sp. TS-e1964]|nr:MAG: hypothetical protein M1829_004995 [Trizodia sp. TS-e1964]
MITAAKTRADRLPNTPPTIDAVDEDLAGGDEEVVVSDGSGGKIEEEEEEELMVTELMEGERVPEAETMADGCIVDIIEDMVWEAEDVTEVPPDLTADWGRAFVPDIEVVMGSTEVSVEITAGAPVIEDTDEVVVGVEVRLLESELTVLIELEVVLDAGGGSEVGGEEAEVEVEEAIELGVGEDEREEEDDVIVLILELKLELELVLEVETEVETKVGVVEDKETRLVGGVELLDTIEEEVREVLGGTDTLDAEDKEEGGGGGGGGGAEEEEAAGSDEAMDETELGNAVVGILLLKVAWETVERSLVGWERSAVLDTFSNDDAESELAADREETLAETVGVGVGVGDGIGVVEVLLPNPPAEEAIDTVTAWPA